MSEMTRLTENGSPFNAKRFAAATLALQGLLSGNGMINVPSDELCIAFATDAIRIADALLFLLESSETPAKLDPTTPEEAIYNGDHRQLSELREWERQEIEAREALAEQGDPSRVDTSGATAPVPEEDPRA